MGNDTNREERASSSAAAGRVVAGQALRPPPAPAASAVSLTHLMNPAAVWLPTGALGFR